MKTTYKSLNLKKKMLGAYLKNDTSIRDHSLEKAYVIKVYLFLKNKGSARGVFGEVGARAVDARAVDKMVHVSHLPLSPSTLNERLTLSHFKKRKEMLREVSRLKEKAFDDMLAYMKAQETDRSPFCCKSSSSKDSEQTFISKVMRYIKGIL